MDDLEAFERSIIEGYKAATVPPETVADVMLEGLVAAAPATAAATGGVGALTTASKVIIGVIVGGALAGAVVWATAGSDQSDDSSAAASEAAVASSQAPSSQPRPGAPAARPVQDPLQPPTSAPVPAKETEVDGQGRDRGRAVRPMREPSAKSESEPTPPSPRESLAAETRLVKQADDELRSGRLDAAARTIEIYRRQFPEGVLAVEVDALRHIMACGSGAPGASDAARRFVEAHAGGLAERVRDACLEQEKKWK